MEQRSAERATEEEGRTTDEGERATEEEVPPPSAASKIAHGAGVVAGGVAYTTYQLIRQVPYLAVISIVLAWAGTALTVPSLSAIGDTFESIGLDLDITARVLSATLTVTHIVVLAAAVVSLLSRGLLREWCCSGQRNICLRALECCIADMVPRIVSLLCFVVLVLQVVLVIVYTALLVVLLFLVAGCEVGSNLVEQILELLDQVPFVSRHAGQSEAARDLDAIAQLCARTSGHAADGIRLVIGAAVLIVAIALMIMSLGASLAFNSMERKRGRAAKTAAATTARASAV
jgi:hypothetical protein